MTPQGGPDGWRFALIQWPKGIHPSRKLHYFKERRTLCGKYRDGMSGWYTEVFENLRPYQMSERCNKCLKKLERMENELQGNS